MQLNNDEDNEVDSLLKRKFLPFTEADLPSRRIIQ